MEKVATLCGGVWLHLEYMIYLTRTRNHSSEKSLFTLFLFNFSFVTFRKSINFFPGNPSTLPYFFSKLVYKDFIIFY
jgi:hypothetical protein